MKDIILLAIVGMLIYIPATAQNNLTVVASSGSLAPYGTVQTLYIDSSGIAIIEKSDLDTGKVDSASLIISTSKKNNLIDTINAANFFALNQLYDANYFDGSGIRLTIVLDGVSHTVELKNFCLNAINRIVKTLNSFTTGTGIKLNYGTLHKDCN